MCSRDNGNAAPISQLETMFHALGFEPSSDEIQHCLSTIRIKNNDTQHDISVHEFIEIISPYIRNRDVLEEAKILFDLFDEDQTGVISFQNLKRLSIDVSLDIPDDILREMIAAADKDGDGSLCREEFQTVIKKCRRPLEDLSSDEDDDTDED
jgi:centrin-1